MYLIKPLPLAVVLTGLLLSACNNKEALQQGKNAQPTEADSPRLNPPLITHIYTADPAAHVFNGRLYIYPSHDIESDIPASADGDQFAMRDYHVFSMDNVDATPVDHGPALKLEDIPWASRQLWAPDTAEKNGNFYLYFPAKDKLGIFRIGVAISDSPTGPFKAQSAPIAGSYSVDPAVYKDTDGSHYLYVGGIWGGQLQRWTKGYYQGADNYPADDEPALMPRIARLNESMTTLAEELRDVQLLDEQGQLLLAGDRDRRFFEGAWMHKYQGKYYLSWSTGDTHRIVYGVGESPYGPFTYQGVILEPVLGWTSHHSIVEFDGKWLLFFHDTELSGGQTHLRNVKVMELTRVEHRILTTNSAQLEK